MGEVVPFRLRHRSPATRESRDAGNPGRYRPTSGERGPVALFTEPSSGRSGQEPLWRDVTGVVLRQERRRQRRTLAQVAERAGMSVQYLSELERGRKEASSEMLAAACGSLGLSLADFATRCAGMFAASSRRPGGPTLLAA